MADRAAIEERIRAACDAARWADAATIGLEAFGGEIYNYLAAVTRSEADAGELFSAFCEALWAGLPRFRGESSFRTWAYMIARHTWTHYVRDPRYRRGNRVPLSDPRVKEVAEQVRTRTQTFQRTAAKDKLAALRAKLDPDDQTLLILRVDRKLAWREIARVMGDGAGDALDDGELTKRSAALRKRFERIKAELRVQLRPEE